MCRVWCQLSEAAKRQSRGASQAGSVHILALYILGLLQILLEVKEEAIDYKDYRQHSGGRSRQEG